MIDGSPQPMINMPGMPGMFAFTTPPGAPTFVPGLGFVSPNTMIHFQQPVMHPTWMPAAQPNMTVRVGPAVAVPQNTASTQSKADVRPPSAQELQAARVLRGAPVICNSGSRSSGGSSSDRSVVNATGQAVMRVGALLGESAPSLATTTAVPETANASIGTELSQSLGKSGSAKSSDITPAELGASTASKSSFRVRRKQQSAPVAVPEAQRIPASSRLEPDDMKEVIRRSVATSSAEMFVPATGMLSVKQAFPKDAIANQLKSNSVGEVVDAFIAVLSTDACRPQGFGDPAPTEECMPMVSLYRCGSLAEGLSTTHEHFKRHFTRTMLNLVADATTPLMLRMNAAATLGVLFKVGFYGENDPYQTLVDILHPFGRIVSPDISTAIVRLLSISECEPSPAARRLHEIFRNGGAAEADPQSAAAAKPSIAPPPYHSAELPKSEDTPYETARRKTVYITRIDPSMSEGELRNVLLEGGDFNKVRLCGDTPGRCKYCFVEYVNEASARKMQRLDGRWFGNQQMRISMAKAPIETNDPRDALFDSTRGKVRACVFGLSMRTAEMTGSAKPLSHSAPTTLAERTAQSDRKHRTDALVAKGTLEGSDGTSKNSDSKSSRETGLMDRVSESETDRV